MTQYRSIILTGASGGLGQVLAPALAGPGIAFLLLGRDETRLGVAAEAARSKGADVTVAAVSVKDEDRMAQVLADFDAAHPVDLLIANAGVKAGNDLGCETPGTAARVIDVNLTSTVRLVDAILPAMRQRGHGQIAILSSLAALSPQADLISYSASKAGLRAYATALRRALSGSGVGVSIVTPGFIDTPMTDRQHGPTPQRLSASHAAERIVRGLRARRTHIAFPWGLLFATRLGNILPVALGDWFNGRFRAKIDPDRDELERPDVKKS